MSSIELYGFEGCPYCQRIRMTLLEKGLEFALIEIDLYNRPDWFGQISPYGKVPVLRHDGVTVYESVIINEYLDEAFPSPPLLPATPALRAQARIWMDYCETRFLATAHKLMSEAADPDRRAGNIDQFTEVLRFIEHDGLRKLSEGPYFFGRQVSLVDLQFSPFFERFGTYERLAGATWPADCVRLREWLDAMKDRPSYRATCRPIEAHLEARRQMQLRIAERRAAAAEAAASAARAR